MPGPFMVAGRIDPMRRRWAMIPQGTASALYRNGSHGLGAGRTLTVGTRRHRSSNAGLFVGIRTPSKSRGPGLEDQADHPPLLIPARRIGLDDKLVPRSEIPQAQGEFCLLGRGRSRRMSVEMDRMDPGASRESQDSGRARDARRAVEPPRQSQSADRERVCPCRQDQSNRSRFDASRCGTLPASPQTNDVDVHCATPSLA